MTAVDVDIALDAHAELGECPVWEPATGTLLWLDIRRHQIHRFWPATGRDDCRDAGQPVGSLGWRRQGGLVLAMRDGFGLLDGDGERIRLAVPVEADRPTQQLNDGKCDQAGRFWAGSASTAREPGVSALYRLEAGPLGERGPRVERVLGGVTMSNGIGWSPDGRRMYYVDSATQGLDVLDFEPETGAVHDRRRLVEVPAEVGIPDGLAVDADGCVWLAIWGAGAVHRYTPAGVLDRVVSFPATQVTSCTFAGSDRSELYVTSAAGGLDERQLQEEPHAGAIFHLRPGVQGLPSEGFAG